MDISGRLIKILPEVRGESQRGPWVRGGFVIETDDTYPRQIAFTLFGEDRIAMLNGLVMNAPVMVTFSPESREYQERWYTDLHSSRSSYSCCSRRRSSCLSGSRSRPAGSCFRLSACRKRRRPSVLR